MNQKYTFTYSYGTAANGFYFQAEFHSGDLIICLITGDVPGPCTVIDVPRVQQYLIALL